MKDCIGTSVAIMTGVLIVGLVWCLCMIHGTGQKTINTRLTQVERHLAILDLEVAKNTGTEMVTINHIVEEVITKKEYERRQKENETKGE